MKQTDHTFIDTDIQIHSIGTDPAVRSAVDASLRGSKPTAMSEFSLVELKGNYIQNLILLRRKISDSISFEIAASRVSNSGGRKAQLMMAQLLKWIGGTDFPINPWPQARSILLTYLDAQILACWKGFQKKVDMIFRDFNCTRAQENPEHIRGSWYATIHKCSPGNVKCSVNDFIMQFGKELALLVKYVADMNPEEKTNELLNIANIAEKTLSDGRFPLGGNTCRQVGDLLIGLQSKSGKELLSSNYKEHGHLHKPLSYQYRQFPVASIRSK